MKYRSVGFVVLMTLLTGIYYFYFFIKTGQEMDRLDRRHPRPTDWLIIVPILHLRWVYHYVKKGHRLFGEKNQIGPFWVFFYSSVGLYLFFALVLAGLVSVEFSSSMVGDILTGLVHLAYLLNYLAYFGSMFAIAYTFNKHSDQSFRLQPPDPNQQVESENSSPIIYRR